MGDVSVSNSKTWCAGISIRVCSVCARSVRKSFSGGLGVAIVVVSCGWVVFRSRKHASVESGGMRDVRHGRCGGVCVSH